MKEWTATVYDLKIFSDIVEQFKGEIKQNMQGAHYLDPLPTNRLRTKRKLRNILRKSTEKFSEEIDDIVNKQQEIVDKWNDFIASTEYKELSDEQKKEKRDEVEKKIKNIVEEMKKLEAKYQSEKYKVSVVFEPIEYDMLKQIIDDHKFVSRSQDSKKIVEDEDRFLDSVDSLKDNVKEFDPNKKEDKKK